ALAHRARLSRSQAGGWPRSLRRARMARPSPSHHTEHRRLRLPDLREGDHSPLGIASPRALPAACASPSLAPARLSRSGLSATFPPPSPPCDGRSPSASQNDCPDAPAATYRTKFTPAVDVHDAVRLD